jgi:tetratricopeptide (TPR) repeat protein
MSRWITAIILCLLAPLALAQGDGAAKADSFYQSGNRLDALPLYEELAKANPKEPLYAERLAVCLYAQSAPMEAGPTRKELLEKIQAEAKTAVALGSQENVARVIANFDLSLVDSEKGETLARAIWRSGEPYFGKRDYKGALDRYAAAAELEPKVAEPALFAGDAAQFAGDLPTAARWYQKAIQIDPHNAKAYARWGDAIMRIAHDADGAKAKYIDAIVANPDYKMGWNGLSTWAQAHGAVLAGPKIKPPSGGMEMFKAMGHDASSRSPWAAYVVDSFAYQSDAKGSPIGTFHQDYPGEAKARRSLHGEAKALHATAVEVALKWEKGEQPPEEFRDLIAVDKADLLECWVLFRWADEGIAQEYMQFSKDHWEKLHEYIERFEIHGRAGAGE